MYVSLNQSQIKPFRRWLAPPPPARVPQGRNLLLSALPPNEYKNLLPHLIPVEFAPSTTLFDAGDPLECLYLPETAVVSLFSVQRDGTLLEVAMVGREGAVGVESVLESESALFCAEVMVAGRLLKVEVDKFRRLLGESERLRRQLFTYFRSLLSQVSYRSACNCRHLLTGRLCNWLLMVLDRAKEDNIRLTHDFIADHLGVRRSGVSVAAKKLMLEGVISYRRGLINIIDRAALEERACECYEMLRMDS